MAEAILLPRHRLHRCVAASIQRLLAEMRGGCDFRRCQARALIKVKHLVPALR